MTEQNTDETITQVGEGTLQDVAGRCSSGVGLSSLALADGRLAATNAKGNIGADLIQAEKKVSQALYVLVNRAIDSASRRAIGGDSLHCDNFKTLGKAIFNRIHD